MKVLFLTTRLPHSEVVGGNRIVYQRIRHLSEQGYEVGVLSFSHDERPDQIENLKKLLVELHILPLPHRHFLIRLLYDYPAYTRPALFWKLYSSAMLKKTGEVVETGRYDVVVSEFSEMGQYLYRNPYLSAVHKVMSCHRCVTASYEKYQNLKEVCWRQHIKSIPQLWNLQKYEFDLYRSADRVLVLTPQDRFTMQYYAQDIPVSVAPTGVDVAYLQEQPSLPKEPIILMTGFMADPANEDGAEWFAHHVWPIIKQKYPDTRFYIVGSTPSRRINRLARKDPRITVTGKVDDLRPYRARAKVFVSPIRLGSGMRTKVLEAMAGGLPVVSTSLGMAGIETETGINCLVADTPELFTQSVEWLLTDDLLAHRISENAKAMVEEKYDLVHGLRAFEQILHSVVDPQ